MSNITKGDKSKSKEGRVVILIRNTLSCPILQSTRYHQNILKGISITEQARNLFQTKQRETTPKVSKAELSFLYETRHLVLFFISANYHWNIPKSIPVTEQTRNLFQTKQREITPKVRKPELSLLYATSHLVLFYISTQYHKNILKGLWLIERT